MRIGGAFRLQTSDFVRQTCDLAAARLPWRRRLPRDTLGRLGRDLLALLVALLGATQTLSRGAQAAAERLRGTKKGDDDSRKVTAKPTKGGGAGRKITTPRKAGGS